MNIPPRPLNPFVSPTLYADLPPSFVERLHKAGDPMSYDDCGEMGYLVMREWVERAASDVPAFKDHPIYTDLTAVFATFPEQDSVILQAR